MKYSLIISILGFLLTSIPLQAQELSYNDYMDEVADIVNQAQLQRDTAYSLGDTPISEACTVFMNKSMFLGEEGKAIYIAFQKNVAAFPQLMKGGTLPRYCPKFTKMNQNQKAMVWVMVMTMMVQFESSCNIKAKAKGPNGTAKGFYQLHAGKEQAYDKFGLCQRNASGSGKQSSQCALSMLERQLEVENGQLFSPKSYWDVLRPRGAAKKADDIQRTLQKSSLCNPITT